MIYSMYFSPTGKTKGIADLIAESIANEIGDGKVTVIDVTSPEAREKEYIFEAEDIVIAASPTYAGRVPNKIMPFWKDCVKGNGAKCVTVVTFGNRSYDESMKELHHLMKENGFVVAGAGAFVTRHAMSKQLAKDRPDEADRADAMRFGMALAKKLAETEVSEVSIEGEVGPYYTPRRADGEKAKFLKAKPLVDEEKCTRCGTCVSVCPMGSISAEDFKTTAICIKCHACIRDCEAGARYFDDGDLASHIQMLEENYMQRDCKNEWYI